MIKFKASNNEKYKIEAIYNNIIYIKKLKVDYLPSFYYLVLLKIYLKEKNTFKLALAI